mmetsp:Transcript_14338/g.26068  ORF Transcript_14338/g.26068 Transcript_14338/m.26068 type:complete len:397 (+) Transcript_14338:123-1313(+)
MLPPGASPSPARKRRRNESISNKDSPRKDSHARILLGAEKWVRLTCGGVQFTATIRTLCAFENTFFSNYFALDCMDRSELHLDFDSHIFSLVLNALRAGAKDLERSFAIINSSRNPCRAQIQHVLEFLGLEWLLGIHIETSLERPTRLVLQDFSQAETLLNDCKRSGLFHHLFSQGQGIPVDRYNEDQARLVSATEDSIVHSFEFFPEDKREEARQRTLMHVPWHGDRLKFHLEALDGEDRAVWLTSRHVFDFGSGNALRPSGMIIFFVIAGLQTSSDLTENKNTLVLSVEGVSDWDPFPFTLLQHDLIPSITNSSHQVLLQLPISKSMQRFARMLRFSVHPPGGWGQQHHDAVLRVAYFELFGDYVIGVPSELHSAERGHFMFDNDSCRCQRVDG